MTSWPVVRLVAGTFILLSLALGISRQPDLRQPVVVGLHRIRWRKSVAERAHALVPDGEHPAQGGYQARLLISD